jgi:hypothetical protein
MGHFILGVIGAATIVAALTMFIMEMVKSVVKFYRSIKRE